MYLVRVIPSDYIKSRREYWGNDNRVYRGRRFGMASQSGKAQHEECHSCLIFWTHSCSTEQVTPNMCQAMSSQNDDIHFVTKQFQCPL